MQERELVEAAVTKAGSAYKLAKTLGLSEGQIGDWRHGRKAMSLEAIADLAAFLELDIGQTLTEALIAKTKGTPRGERIKRAVGKTLRAVSGATALTLAFLVAAATGAGSYMNAGADRLLRRR